MYLLDTNVVSELRRPLPHGAVLAWLHSIAATASVHKLVVVTRNVADFTALKVQTANPFKPSSQMSPTLWASAGTRARWRHQGGYTSICSSAVV
jgi:hypothetical protein